MQLLNQTNIEIDFVAESVHNRTMSLIITCGQQQCMYRPLKEGKTTWQGSVEFPTKLILNFGGKRQNDTIVDSTGNILKNMTVKIAAIRMDGINSWYLWSELSTVLELDASNEILLGQTISDNGRVELVFNEPNAFFWLTKSKLSQHFSPIKEFSNN